MDHVAYLLKVITQWEEFCKHHPKTKEAITHLLIENEALKLENQQLKERLK
jgi:regulator of replication initiation timing